MKANGVLIVLGSLLTIVILPYIFFPETIGGSDGTNETRSHVLDADGYWGHIDAEHNWCEYNYHHSFYIAEPFNVLTSFLFVIIALIQYLQYGRGALFKVVFYDFIIETWLFALIGVGSMLFHASLKYEMQLLDELPMLYFTSYASIMLYYRNDNLLDSKNNASKIFEHRIVCYISVAIDISATAIGFLTPRDAIIHNLMRAFTVSLFAITLLFTFIAGANAAQEADKVLSESKNKVNKVYKDGSQPQVQAVTIANDFFDISFFGIVFGLVAWLIDNFACDLLQNLPLNIPYPQLHAFGWHVGVCIGLYYCCQMAMLHRLVVCVKHDPKDIKINRLPFGLKYFSLNTKCE